MIEARLGLPNRHAVVIAILAAVHIVLNAFYLNTWWSMIVLMLLCTRPVMKPDRLLAMVWTAEVGIAIGVSLRLFSRGGSTVVFVLSSMLILFICGKRLLVGARGDPRTGAGGHRGQSGPAADSLHEDLLGNGS